MHSAKHNNSNSNESSNHRQLDLLPTNATTIAGSDANRLSHTSSARRERMQQLVIDAEHQFSIGNCKRAVFLASAAAELELELEAPVIEIAALETCTANCTVAVQGLHDSSTRSDWRQHNRRTRLADADMGTNTHLDIDINRSTVISSITRNTIVITNPDPTTNHLNNNNNNNNNNNTPNIDGGNNVSNSSASDLDDQSDQIIHIDAIDLGSGAPALICQCMAQSSSHTASLFAGASADGRNYGDVARGLLLLGLLLRGGFGIELDKPRALNCFGAAAQRGNYLALHQVACCLYNGWGVAKDVPRANALVRLCISSVIRRADSKFIVPPHLRASATTTTSSTAEYQSESSSRSSSSSSSSSSSDYGESDDGDWIAMYMKGYSAHDGFGCQVDATSARRAYRFSAERGLGFAQYNLGMSKHWSLPNNQIVLTRLDGTCLDCVVALMYDLGEGEHIDKVEARRLYELAADKGHLLANVNLYGSLWLMLDE
jgi:hypothetical protein